MHFKSGHLGGLLTEFVFNGKPVEHLDFSVPTAANADVLAEYILTKIAGNEGAATT